MPASPQSIRIAGYHAEITVHSRAVRFLEQTLLDRAAALCVPNVTPNIVDLGHATAEMVGLVTGGTFDIAYISSISFVRYVPELAAFDIPFLVPNRARALDVLDRRIRSRLDAATLAGMPVHVLAIWDNGARQISNSVRPIRSPDDCPGLRLRIQKSPIIRRGFELLGFKVTEIDIGKLGAAIRAGEVDAQENPLINMQGYGIDQLHAHVSLTNHLFGVTLLICNPHAWEHWSTALRTVLTDAIAAATTYQCRLAVEEDTIAATKLTRQGNLLQEITLDAQRAFAGKIAPLVADHRQLLASSALSGLRDG